MTVVAIVVSLVTEPFRAGTSTRSVPAPELTCPVGASGWSGDVEVAAECFADDVAGGRVIVGGSFFDRSTKVGVKSDGNDIGWAARQWWASAAARFERLDVDVTGNVVGEGVDVSVGEDASGFGDVGLG
jgi:hypothetical protein